MMPGVGENVRTDFRLDSLLWGCAMAFLVHDRKSKDKLTSTLNPFCWSIISLAIFIPHYSFKIQALTPLMLIGIFLVPFLIPVMLAGTVLHPGWMLSRILENPLLKWIGRLSYSLYLWQELFLFDGGKFHSQSVAVNVVVTVS